MRGIALCLVAVLAVNFVQSITPEQEKMMHDIHQECATESGVDDDEFLKAMKGEGPGNDTFKKHTLCFAKKAGFVDAAGNLQADDIKGMLQGNLEQAQYDLIVNTCLEQKATPEDTSYELAKCMFNVKFNM